MRASEETIVRLLNSRITKANNLAIIRLIDDNEELFAILMHYFLCGTHRETQAASWAIGYIGEQKPHLLTPYHSQFINQLKSITCNDAAKRNIVRVYQTCEIPPAIEGELYDIAFRFLSSHKEPIAVRAFSVRICERISNRYMDLKPELIAELKRLLPNASSGLKNRATKTLYKLQNRLNM
jgi:hypothetical protein